MNVRRAERRREGLEVVRSRREIRPPPFPGPGVCGLWEQKLARASGEVCP